MSTDASALPPGRSSKPDKIPDRLDEAVLAEFPLGTEILMIKQSGASAWVQTVRIDARHSDGSVKPYFMETEHGEAGRRMMSGSFESEKLVHEYAPYHVPKPVAWGHYKIDPDMWFFVSEFRELVEDVPDVKNFVSIIAKMHKESAGKSPDGKFGFPVPTHLGYIPNDNSWQESWEVWYTNALKRMFDEEEKSHGSDDTQEQLEMLKNDFYQKVIPRLLRPLESNGRTVTPCLIHSDLWLGNVMMDANTDEIVIFDSCAYWGHNESDLGSWRAPRYWLGPQYLQEYQKQVGQSAPEKDWDDRNALYAIFMDEMRRLIKKYPAGFEGLKDS